MEEVLLVALRVSRSEVLRFGLRHVNELSHSLAASAAHWTRLLAPPELCVRPSVAGVSAAVERLSLHAAQLRACWCGRFGSYLLADVILGAGGSDLKACGSLSPFSAFERGHGEHVHRGRRAEGSTSASCPHSVRWLCRCGRIGYDTKVTARVCLTPLTRRSGVLGTENPSTSECSASSAFSRNEQPQQSIRASTSVFQDAPQERHHRVLEGGGSSYSS